MDRKQAAQFYRVTLENTDIKAERLIEEVYLARGKTDKEIDQIIEEYNAIISEAQKQGHIGKDLVDFLMNNPNKVEYIEKDNDGNVANIKIEGNTVTIGGKKVDKPSETPDLKFGDDSVNKPINTIPTQNNIPNFHNSGNDDTEIKQEPVKPDDFSFDDSKPANPRVNDEPISFPNTESGLHVNGEQAPETVRNDDFSFDNNKPANPRVNDEPINFPNTESPLNIEGQDNDKGPQGNTPTFGGL